MLSLNLSEACLFLLNHGQSRHLAGSAVKIAQFTVGIVGFFLLRWMALNFLIPQLSLSAQHWRGLWRVYSVISVPFSIKQFICLRFPF